MTEVKEREIVSTPHAGYHPHKCLYCEREFAWGADVNSALVPDSHKDCGENAHWKLFFHMKAEHSSELMRCPRRGEMLEFPDPRDIEDYWYEHEGVKQCSFCGSIHPDLLFKLIGEGAKIGPTDKSYKIYVDMVNPIAGQEVYRGGESGPAFDRATGLPSRDDLTDEEKKTGRYSRTTLGPAPATKTDKFYFQHLSLEEQDKFIALYNDKKISMGAPGHFYVKPFFCQRITTVQN